MHCVIDIEKIYREHRVQTLTFIIIISFNTRNMQTTKLQLYDYRSHEIILVHCLCRTTYAVFM